MVAATKGKERKGKGKGKARKGKEEGQRRGLRGLHDLRHTGYKEKERQ